METGKTKSYIAEVLNIDADSITADTTFVDDLGRILLISFRLSWGLKKSMTLNWRMSL